MRLSVSLTQKYHHFSAIGYFTQLAAQAGCLGQCFVGGVPSGNAGAGMVPTFGAEGRLSTNPVAWSAPAKSETPFMLDIATTQVRKGATKRRYEKALVLPPYKITPLQIAGNKIELARRMGVPLHPGFITDDDGTVIEEEVHAGETYLQAPFGGTRENGSHKGYGMGVVADLFFNGLSTQAEDEPDERGRLTAGGGFFAAFDIEHFTDREQYDRAADGLLADLRNTKPAPGFERVLYPGLRGAEIAAERRANGIPYHPEVQLPLGLAVVDLLRDALDCAVLEDR